MINLEPGVPLRFEQLLLDNVRLSTHTDLIATTYETRNRLSVVNQRLVFEDTDPSTSRSRQDEDSRVNTGATEITSFSKYDKLVLDQLFCRGAKQHDPSVSDDGFVEEEHRDQADPAETPVNLKANVTREALPFDFRLRNDATGSNGEQDEFLVIHANIIVRGKGLDDTFRTTEEIYTERGPILDAAWCVFRHFDRDVRPEHATITPSLEYFDPVETVCVAEQRRLHVHKTKGEDYAYATAFPMRKIWSFPLGLLIERDSKVASNLTSVSGYSNLFAVTSPLEEPSPVLFLGNNSPNQDSTLLLHPDSVVVGTGDLLPLVLMFEPARNTHSLWLARFSTVDEIDRVLDNLKGVPSNGEPLHFHPSNDSSPRLSSRSSNRVAPRPDLFPVSPIVSSPSAGARPPGLADSARKASALHKDVLMSASGKYPPPERPLSLSSGPSGVRQPGMVSSLMGSNSRFESSREGSSAHLMTSLNSSTSAIIPMELSFNVTSRQNSVSLLGSPASGLNSPSRHDTSNIPAEALRDLRSAMSISQAAIQSLISGDGPHHSMVRRNSRSGSGHASHDNQKKYPRIIHATQPHQIVTDELAHPKVALVHIWSESSRAIRQSAGKEAFLLCDSFKHLHFCFISTVQQALRCVRLDQQNNMDLHSTKVSFHSITSLSAISACKVSDHGLMIVMDPSHALTLYSGPLHPLLRINVTPGYPRAGLDFPLTGFGIVASSPISAGSAHHTVASSHFSPVETMHATPPVLSAANTALKRLIPCAGNKFVLESQDGLRVFRLPQRPSSDLIEMALEALRMHLNQEIFGRILHETYKLSFTGTRKFLSLSERWDMCFRSVLAAFGCSVGQSASPAITEHRSDFEKMVSRISSKLEEKFQAADNVGAGNFRITVDLNGQCFREGIASAALLCLHLVLEEARLSELWREERNFMLQWMAVLGRVCRADPYVTYCEDELEKAGVAKKNPVFSFTGNAQFEAGKKLPMPPPDLLGAIDSMLQRKPQRYPLLKNVNDFSASVILLVALTASSTADSFHKMLALLDDGVLTLEHFQYLPRSLRIALRHRFAVLAEDSSFETLPHIVYEIAGWKDALACRQAVSGQGLRDFCLADIQRRNLTRKSDAAENYRKRATPLPHSLITRRFASDARVREAEKLLTTSESVTIPLNSMHSTNEVEFRKSQEAWLKSVAPRTMSLPVARGMLSLRTEFAYATEKLTAPDMVYSGMERGTGRKVSVKNDDLPPGHDVWPRFHNGVATGLRLRRYDQDCIKFDHHWLAFNAAQYTRREAVEYAGIFLGMALNGLIDLNTDPVDLHNMLIKLEDSVSISVILGMGCVNRGTQDKRYFRMISLHIVSLIEEQNVELLIPQNIYVASLLSLGLLYRASANRYISERLLAEIWTGTGTETDATAQPVVSERESSSLAAALGLGFVLLGLGNESALGLADLEIPQRLRTFMIGGLHGRPSASSRRLETTASLLASSRARDDDQSINTHITAPGAILALAMIYMKTERRDIADWMAMPQTLQELDEIRPDFLLLRVVARSLIMWSTVEATEKWVNANFPVWILKNVFLHSGDLEKKGMDVVSITQAYFFILAGSSLSLGLRFAGTASETAKELLMTIAKMMMKWAEDTTLSKRCSPSLTQTCLTTILLALACVMAGTGDLEVFRLFRYMHGRACGPRTSITYGHQMGIHMGIGLLFLGCGMYTLSTSNEALAAMLIAFYPMWPKNPADNRYHLQAFRHMYVLAVENRLVMSRSIYGGTPLQTRITVLYKDSSSPAAFFTTPCVLPELVHLKKISVASGNHWLNFNGNNNWNDFRQLLLNGGLVVLPPNGKQRKQRAGLEIPILSEEDSGVLFHLDRFVMQPTDTKEVVIASMKKFLAEYRVSCMDKELAALFGVVSRNWFHQNPEKSWIAWVLYECVSRGRPEAFLEILVWSKDKRDETAGIAGKILRGSSSGVDEREWKWRLRLRKDNLLTSLND